MKSVIVTAVSIITVLTVAEGQNFPVEPGEQPEPTSDDIEYIVPNKTEVQTMVEDELKSHSGPEYRASAEDDQPFGENYDFNQQEENRQNERKGNKTACKAKTTCVLLGGSCVTNATLCSGRLVPSGCKGPNCQCCVPDMDSKLNSLISNIDSKFYNMNSSLVSIANKQDMDSKLNNLISNNMNSSLVSIANKQGTVEAKITNLEEELQSSKENLTSTLNNISSSLVSIAKKLTCPDGFIRSRPSNQCFKLFTDSTRSWSAARTKCREEGLELAKPSNPVELRRFMSKSYVGEPWIGAQGTGSSVKWDRDGSTLSSSSSAWCPGNPGSMTSSAYCLFILTHPSNLNSYPNQPYHMYPCSYAKYPLCELVVE